MRFLANTGFLFAGLSLADKLRAAARAGFDGVECHDDVQGADQGELHQIVTESGLRVGSLNTRMGATTGCAALPDAQAQFVQDITEAHQAATAIGARAIHVLAGRGDWNPQVMEANLRRALDLTDRMLLIEPINPQAMPGYALSNLTDALELHDRIGDPRLRVMFDWFHMANTLGPDRAEVALRAHKDAIGHVQLAAATDRSEPDAGLVDLVAQAGFDCVGLEYRPTRPEAQLLAELRSAGQTA